jgi:integrase
MNGHIRRRGERSFELKYDLGIDPRTGQRRTRYVSFRGSKREANAKLAELVAAVGTGSHIDVTKTTIVEFVRTRIDQWEASGKIGTRTAERYRQLAVNQIAPHIGAIVLQKLTALDIEHWHTILLTNGRVRGGKGGIAPRTVRHCHRLLSEALDDAVGNVVSRNVLKEKRAKPPRVPDIEKIIVQDVPAFIDRMKPRGERYSVPTMTAMFTGLRIGEVLALRWGRVDLERRVIKVHENLEVTKKYGLRFKSPKTKAGRREVTLPNILVDAVREYRKAQLEQRMKLGAGKIQNDDLLFTDIEGAPLHPYHYGTNWSACAENNGFPGITFHALRHTHVSQLIDQNVDIVTISKRIGHSSPEITLRTYSHLFARDDGKAAAAINAAFKTVPA